MLRCPKCGQTARAAFQPENTRGLFFLSFKKKAVLGVDGEPIDLDEEIKRGTELRCPFCRGRGPIGDWRNARLMPGTAWDEEEDLGEVKNPYAFTEEDVEDESDLDRVEPITEDPYGGDDDGSDT